VAAGAPPLPPGFLARPFAHRGLHGPGRPENSRAAVAAAVAAGHGIEIDLRLSADGRAMVFHDDALARLTGAAGRVSDRTAADLSALPLLGGGETVPAFDEILALVRGRVPLLVEVKDEDGALGPGIGQLAAAAARDATGYAGPLAFMSFNPNTVAALARHAPDRPRGLTTCAFDAAEWGHVPAATRARLAAIPDAGRTGAAFVSHDRRDLDRPRLAELRAQGLALLAWTIRAPAEAEAARRVVDQITAEGAALS
jgi:glycerophosphoryl diester phosphodiesterase